MENFLGHDGFIWWIGVVEDIIDPDVLGRCKVRIFGYHDNDAQIPTADLPWATAIHSPNTRNLFSPLNVGEWVFGFFIDSINAQEPVILGYIPTQKDTVASPRNFKRVQTQLDQSRATCWEIGNSYFEIISANTSSNGYIELKHNTGSKLNLDSLTNVQLFGVGNTRIESEYESVSTVAQKDINIAAVKNIKGHLITHHLFQMENLMCLRKSQFHYQ